jgi:serine/threonine protein kinase
VKHADRSAFVTQLRTQIADYEIREGSLGQSLSAAQRTEYHPIAYMVPLRPAALGFDLSADENRRKWVTEAYARGLFITPRVDLPSPGGTRAAVGAYVPVRKNEEAIGIVVASFQMARFVDEVFTDQELSGVELMLYEQEAQDDSLVYSTAGSAVDDTAASGRYERPFHIGNRQWRIVFQGTERLGTRLPVVVLVVCATASAVFALLFFLFARIRLLREGAPRLGQYELLEMLGEGGMGTVYRAHHMLLRRPTAVKVIRSEIASRGSMRERFEREVQAASELTHPNNIVVYDYGHTPEGELYYAMEFVDGIDLHRLVERFGPLPSNRVAHTLQLASEALAEAHSRGIVHRDVKPANIMLSRCGGLYDFPKVLDFGLALTRKRDQPELTLDGAVLGTPHFMAPEQGLGADDLGPAADVYALGCVAYFLLTGRNLFEAPTVRELVGKHMTARPIPVADLAEQHIDPELARAVMLCLDKLPAARPTAADLAKLVSDLAATWTNDDAKAWWEEHMANIEDVGASSVRNRMLTVRLDDRATTLDAAMGTTTVE